MKTLIKVCGMRDSDNIMGLINLNPDMIGMIFYPKSPRFVTNYKELTSVFHNDRKFKLVGVFVNEDPDIILDLDEVLNFDFIQLHGSESPDYCLDLKSHKLKIIKAFGISDVEDFNITDAYHKCSDMFVFDTKTKNHGGSGRKFNWELINSYKGSTPFLLSGGIGPEDFPEVNNKAFAGLDINSRFELSPGLKDIVLLSKYIKKLRDD